MILRATDLRIGNYLLSWEKGLQGQPDKVTLDTLARLSEIQPWEEYMALKPIPLTSDILEKCEFEHMSQGKKDVYERGAIELKNADSGGAWILRVYGAVVNYKPFRYLHQLQNLHHALTGEELELKL